MDCQFLHRLFDSNKRVLVVVGWDGNLQTSVLAIYKFDVLNSVISIEVLNWT